MEAVHGLDSTLGRQRVVETNEAEALAEVGVLVNEDLGANDTTEWLEHLDKVSVLYVVREMVDKEITSLGTCGEGRREEVMCVWRVTWNIYGTDIIMSGRGLTTGLESL